MFSWKCFNVATGGGDSAASTSTNTKYLHPLLQASTPCHGCAETLACTTTKCRLGHPMMSWRIFTRRRPSIDKTGVHSNAIILTSVPHLGEDRTLLSLHIDLECRVSLAVDLVSLVLSISYRRWNRNFP